MADMNGHAGGKNAYKDYVSSIPQSISFPTEWKSKYDELILKNAGMVTNIESGLRQLTYFIPGRFRESEIASESLHSGVQLLSMYHDSLLAKAVARLPRAQRPHPSPHNRYTKFWSRKSPIYRRIALLLQITQYTELLWEMAAKRKGEKVRWRVVVILEIVKAFCRLLLLRLTNSRPLLSPPLPQREVDPSTLEQHETTEQQNEQQDRPSTPSDSASEDTKWTMPRTGLSLPSLPDSHDISNYLLSRVLTADDIKPPKALLHRVSGKGEIAEWLYILRPVITAMAMQHFANDKKNWKPWLIGFGLEYGARQLAKQDLQQRSGMRNLTALEREELSKRGWSMGWWMMRGAFYENITKNWVQGFADKLRGRMLIDMLGVIVEDYEFLWDQYYFPTATL